MRRTTELDHLIGLKKVVASDSGLAEAEFVENRLHLLGVLGRDPHKEVNIFRKSRCAVKRQSVPSHQEKLNFVREQ